MKQIKILCNSAKSPEAEKAYAEAWEDCQANEEKVRAKLSAMMVKAAEEVEAA